MKKGITTATATQEEEERSTIIAREPLLPSSSLTTRNNEQQQVDEEDSIISNNNNNNVSVLSTKSAHHGNSKSYNEFIFNSESYYKLRVKECFRGPVCRWCVRLFSCTGVLLFVLLMYMVLVGMFKSMNHSIPRAKNGTVIEPNTKFEYPIQLPRVVLPSTKQKLQQEKIFGLTLWVYTIPIPLHPHVNVAAVGLYVDEAEGKRRLAKYRMKEQLSEDDLLRELVLNGRRLGMTLKYRMASTPPSAKEMLDGWIDDLKLNAKLLCPDKATEEEIDLEVKGFADFVTKFDLFKKGKEFNMEKSESFLLGYLGVDRTQALKIGNECLSLLMFYNEIKQRKLDLGNLFHEVFEK